MHLLKVIVIRQTYLLINVKQSYNYFTESQILTQLIRLTFLCVANINKENNQILCNTLVGNISALLGARNRRSLFLALGGVRQGYMLKPLFFYDIARDFLLKAFLKLCQTRRFFFGCVAALTVARKMSSNPDLSKALHS